MTDWNKVAKLAIDDEESFTELYNHFFPIVYRSIFIQTQDENIADEIIGTVFWKTFNNLEKFDETRASFQTWLLKIAKNEVITYFRAQSRKTEHETAFDEEFEFKADEYFEPEQQILREERTQQLKVAIEKLNERERKIITLKYYLDMKDNEIAEKLDLTPQNVRVILNRARSKLKKFLTEEGD